MGDKYNAIYAMQVERQMATSVNASVRPRSSLGSGITLALALLVGSGAGYRLAAARLARAGRHSLVARHVTEVAVAVGRLDRARGAS